jgi:hypothetical protein
MVPAMDMSLFTTIASYKLVRCLFQGADRYSTISFDDHAVNAVAEGLSPECFTPKHDRQSGGDNSARCAPPDWNHKPAYNDLPPQEKPKQMESGNNGEDGNCGRCERLHHTSKFQFNYWS